MKTFLFGLNMLVLVCCIPVTMLAQKRFTVNGKISGLTEKSLVSITDANTPSDTFAYTKVKNGAFILKGSMREPLLVSLNFGEAKKRSVLFLDNNEITITGDLNNLQKLTVTGSSSQTDFQAFQDEFNPLFEKYSKAAQQMQMGLKTDSAQLILAQTFTAIQEKIEVFLQQHPASAVSPFLLLVTAQMSDDIAVLEKRYTKLSPEIQTGFYGKYIKNTIDEKKIGAVGSDAIEFTQNDVNGKPVSLSSFKGKYVLVDFWASWCGPCRMENPNVVNTYKEFQSKNFTVLGVSLDKAKDPWLKAINDDGLAWTHVSDLKFWSNEAAIKYHIQSIPQNFLIDPSGKIVAKNLRGPALKAKLCELLGCN